jgi:Fe2+ or Zn2+ uptake regulation protein
MVRPKHCLCGARLDYSATDGKVHLACSSCERNYPLDGTINTGQDITLDDTDYHILRHIAFVAYSCPNELIRCGISYATVIRRVRRLAKAGYLHLHKKNNHRLFLYRTERLEALAAEKKWCGLKKK